MSQMRVREYRVRFLAPAFLGNAEQNAQWRTPPFKALLRQWWRVAYAAADGFRVNEDRMRTEEGLLFGAAANTSTRSLVRIRLDRWDEGRLQKGQWQTLPKVSHPEVNFPVDAGLYMGYGPVTLPKGERNPVLKANAAIQVNETAGLKLAFPAEHARLLDQALWLMHQFGTLGGRSRNGWGSFVLEALNDETSSAMQGQKLPLQEWQEALAIDWPHAIGKDERPLIWQTAAHDDWRSLMRTLAEIKIGLRTQFRFHSGKGAERPEGRHWLSYPVTNHSVKPWGNNARLPNSLRFKVRATEGGKLIGVVFHVPCKPPASFRPDTRTLEQVWQQVHGYLDGKLARSPQ